MLFTLCNKNIYPEFRCIRKITLLLSMVTSLLSFTNLSCLSWRQSSSFWYFWKHLFISPCSSTSEKNEEKNTTIILMPVYFSMIDFYRVTNKFIMHVLMIWDTLMLSFETRSHDCKPMWRDCHSSWGNALNSLFIMNSIQPFYSVENYLINVWDRIFPWGVSYFKMELHTFQCYYMQRSHIVKKIVYFRDLFDILK